MSRIVQSRDARAGAVGYFVRRTCEDCAAIALHDGNRNDVIARGLSLGDAEKLCASWIENRVAQRSASGRFIVIKRRHGLNRSRYKGDDGMKRWVGLGVIGDNLINISQALAKPKAKAKPNPLAG